MLRVMLSITVAGTLLSAFWLYALNYDTRRIATQVQEHERTRARLANDIAVLKAERAYLARPERIEPLARLMGLGPARPEQFRLPVEAGEAADRVSTSPVKSYGTGR